MIKNLLIYLLVLSTTSCSTYRFIGNPITINSENLNIKLSEEDLVFFNENQKEIWPLLDINDDKIPGMSVNKANKELNWKAELDIDDICKDTYNFALKNIKS